MSSNIPGNVLKHSGDCCQTFHAISSNILGNYWTELHLESCQTSTIRLILAKDNFYKIFVRKSNNMYHHYAFKNLQNHLNQSIQIAKQNYVNKIAQKLGDPNTSSKCYWSLLKTLLNGKKIPCIPPLFHVDKFIVDFQEKSEIFNSFFADQCPPISNGSTLPSKLPLWIDSTLSSCHFVKEDIP